MKKNLLFTLITVLILAVSITGCGKTAAASSAANGPFTVKIAATPTVGKGEVEFKIKTNLPDDTKLLVGLSNSDNINYYEKEDLVVKDGAVSTKKFNDSGKGLAPGEYSFEVTTLIAANQPDSVQKIFGENGSKLTGASITTDDDVSDNDRYVDYSVNVKID
jgi:hypothetical protein